MWSTLTTAAIAVIAARGAIADQVVGPGHAIVKNNCQKPVTMWACRGDGSSDQAFTLQPGDSHPQSWTALNKGGYSLKLYAGAVDPTKIRAEDHVPLLQYEYAIQMGGMYQGLYWDISAVNGNPWAGNWAVDARAAGDAPTTCTAHGQAYRCSTDDQNGMQSSCDTNADITLTLCSLDQSKDTIGNAAPGSNAQAMECSAGYEANYPSATSAASPASYSAPAVSSAPVATTTPAPVPASSAAISVHVDNKQVVHDNTPTSLATVVSSAPAENVVNNNIQVPASPATAVVMTEVVTELAVHTVFVDAPARRRRHLHDHGHLH